jgi:tetratricopeptide (TPR) repeat protein
MKQALLLGTNDALLYFHAAMIYESLSEHESARDYLQRALALNPQFHLLYADAAQSTLQKLSKDSAAAKSRGTANARP